MIDIEKRASDISGGVFMIGLAVLFLTNYWFPGILFVIGAASIAQGLAKGRAWYGMQGALWTIGIGLVFAFGFSLPLLFLLIGASMVVGSIWKPPFLGHDDEDDEDDYVVRSRRADDLFEPEDGYVDVYEDEKPKRRDMR